MFYSDDAKLIYESGDGTRFDPLALRRKLLLSSRGGLNDSLATWTDTAAAEVARAGAEESLVAAARAAFGFAPFDAENGVTDRVALDELERFLRWLEAKKAKG